MPIRMSPNRGSSCWLPLVASGLPLSDTWERLMLATACQTAAAFWNCSSQVASENLASRV